jgi:glycosyltransferase involved in cell wall biosynthesis
MIKNQGENSCINYKKYKISIIIPCRNEEKYIAKCLDSIIAQDYPIDNLEVFVVDGMSKDKTVQVIKSYNEQPLSIKILKNPKKITPCAFNLGIKYSKADIIMIMGAHSAYKKDYISKCIKYLTKYNVDNVGGISIALPGNKGILADSIALSISHPFGVGNAYFRIGSKEPKYVDTVFGGCYKKEVFEKSPYPWYRHIPIEFEEDGVECADEMWEDVGFCMNVKEHGFDIWCDFDNPVEHIDQKQIALRRNKILNFISF